MLYASNDYFWCEKHKKYNMIFYLLLIGGQLSNKNAGKPLAAKREEQKLAAQEFVKEKYNIEATEDEADAISLGTAAILEQDKDTLRF